MHEKKTIAQTKSDKNFKVGSKMDFLADYTPHVKQSVDYWVIFTLKKQFV